jgi:hypothetical protein
MALDFTGLVTVLGKYIKQINVSNGHFAALETIKDEIFAQLNTEGLQDVYVDLPGIYQGAYDNVTGFISALIGEATKVLTNEEYVIEQLPISETDIQSVLFALHAYMTANSQSFDASTITLGGADTDTSFSSVGSTSYPANAGVLLPGLFVSRLLDGLNAPVSGVAAYHKYINVESQMSEDCTIFAKITASSPGQEVLQIFHNSPSQAFYTNDTPSPGLGPALVNGEAGNLIPQNYDFSQWSGDNPQPGWTLTGGAAGTDWEDESGTGVGPLKISTVGTYVKQQIPGLTRLQSYLFAVAIRQVGASGTAVAKLRVENVDGLTVHKNFGNAICSDVSDATLQPQWIYGFWAPTATVNLDDIYLSLEHDAESDAATYLVAHKAFVIPVQYFNGLGLAFINPYMDLSDILNQALGVTIEELPLESSNGVGLAIANDDAGVFQAFFRKAYGVQLPTNDAGAETVNDSLAT